MTTFDDISLKWMGIVLGVVSFLAACSSNMEPDVHRQTTAPEPSANVAKRIPPLDAALPARFETASFGLG